MQGAVHFPGLPSGYGAMRLLPEALKCQLHTSRGHYSCWFLCQSCPSGAHLHRLQCEWLPLELGNVMTLGAQGSRADGGPQQESLISPLQGPKWWSWLGLTEDGQLRCPCTDLDTRSSQTVPSAPALPSAASRQLSRQAHGQHVLGTLMAARQLLTIRHSFTVADSDIFQDQAKRWLTSRRWGSEDLSM